MQAEMNVYPLSTRLTDSTYLCLPVLKEKMKYRMKDGKKKQFDERRYEPARTSEGDKRQTCRRWLILKTKSFPHFKSFGLTGTPTNNL